MKEVSKSTHEHDGGEITINFNGKKIGKLEFHRWENGIL